MMDWSYIIKRVLVGVILFIVIYLLRSYIFLCVKANTIESYSWGFHSGTPAVTDTQWYFDLTDNQFLGERYGYLYFTFDILEVVNTDAPVNLRSVAITSGTTAYLCHVGTVNTNNLGSGISSNILVNNTTYSAYCPVDFGYSGLDRVTFNFVGGGNSINTFSIQTSSQATFEKITQEEFSSVVQDITSNQDQNTQQQIESQKVCNTYVFDNADSFPLKNSVINSSGNISSNNNYMSTNYVPLNVDSTVIYYSISNSQSSPNFCFYDKNKSVISCLNYRNDIFAVTGSSGTITVPTGSYYARFSTGSSVSSTFHITTCQNGNQAIADQQQQINDTLNNSNVDSASSSGSNFFLNFADPVNPLQDVLMFPINLLSSANSSCSPITLSYLNQNISIPCGDTVFWDKPIAQDFRTWWNLFFGGFAIYLLCFKLFHIISDSFDPFKDDISKVGGIS